MLCWFFCFCFFVCFLSKEHLSRPHPGMHGAGGNWLPTGNGEMAGPTPVGFVFLKNALGVNSESWMSERPTPHWLSSSNWSPQKAICTLENAALGFQKTRKSRASCLGSTMFSTVCSMECTCSGEAVRKARGPMRCFAHQWHR